MSLHIAVSISSHGYGHAAQVSPVLHQLRKALPALRITLLTNLDRSYLERRFPKPFNVQKLTLDFGMEMASAIDVLIEQSALRYSSLHRNWKTHLKREADALWSLEPTLLLSNVSYLSIAGAAYAGIPAIAMCSLNWADIYESYCGQRPEAKEIIEQMRDAYRKSQYFLKLQPAMPMKWMHKLREVGPVACIGNNRRNAINRQLALPESERLVLLGLGGVSMRLPIEQWPRLPQVRWIIPSHWNATRSDFITLESLAMPFIDILCSSDLLITKPGYGAFTEAACNGVPVLYVERGDWPEERFLVTWLTEHGRAQRVEREELKRGDVYDQMTALLNTPAPPAPNPTGIKKASDCIAGTLIDIQR